jgi:Phosphotransferase enzyme family
MFIDSGNIAQFLAERRLLEFDSVIDGDFIVVDQSSRNRNLKVVRNNSPGFFVKQLASRSPEFAQTFETEAACYQLARNHPKIRPLNSLMPKFHYFDPANYILVLELLPNGESVWEHHQRVRHFPLEIAQLQGEILGRYHSQININGAADDLKVFKRQIPWILSIHETNPQYLGQVSQGNAQLISIVQQYPEFQTALASLRAGWNYKALIHGDIKWENLMLCRSHESAPLELKLIDWEIADIGDECWDAGAVLQAYLSFWIFSLPLNGGTDLNAAASASPFDSEGIKGAMAAYWSSYSAARKLDAASSELLLVRSMSCAAARMIQTAYESIQKSPQISSHALCKLQMSMNILREPATAIQDLMGL